MVDWHEICWANWFSQVDWTFLFWLAHDLFRTTTFTTNLTLLPIPLFKYAVCSVWHFQIIGCNGFWNLLEWPEGWNSFLNFITFSLQEECSSFRRGWGSTDSVCQTGRWGASSLVALNMFIHQYSTDKVWFVYRTDRLTMVFHFADNSPFQQIALTFKNALARMSFILNILCVYVLLTYTVFYV